MRYRVLRDGAVSQREGDGFVERKAGDLVDLTRPAAEHLIAVGLVEEVPDEAPAPRRRKAGEVSE